MKDRFGRGPVTHFRLTARVAEQRIRTLAADSANIDWSIHAFERMDERGITVQDALRALRQGMLSGQPEPLPRNEWKCKMVRRTQGNRDVGVVTIMLASDRLFVKTVEWEDLK
ncbi:MAG: DUF4258 domain-containing protein [Alphaproteobacteria bacterium]|nr:DUF4258 domain-containing protein [Alphaproteobacteria bacterium]